MSIMTFNCLFNVGISFTLTHKSHLVILTLKRIPSVFMYAMNIQNDVIGLVLRENCKSKQVIDFIAWPSRYFNFKLFKKNNYTEKTKILYFLNLVYFLSLDGLWQNHVLYWPLTDFMWRNLFDYFFHVWKVNIFPF
jgi:hypothetical protein